MNEYHDSYDNEEEDEGEAVFYEIANDPTTQAAFRQHSLETLRRYAPEVPINERKRAVDASIDHICQKYRDAWKQS